MPLASAALTAETLIQNKSAFAEVAFMVYFVKPRSKVTDTVTKFDQGYSQPQHKLCFESTGL